MRFSNLFSGIKGEILIIVIIVIGFLLVEQAVYAFTPISDIAAVVSSSMVHSSTVNQTYYAFLYSLGYTKAEIDSWPFPNGINPGTLVIAIRVPPSEIKVGDVIIFKSPIGDIIHRVIFIYHNSTGYYFTTKGDANPMILPIERNVSQRYVVGVVMYAIPYLGYPRYLLNLI